MRTADTTQHAMFSYRSLEERIPAERLLRASLIQVLFSIRSERQLGQHLEYNLLYRWFVGLSMIKRGSSRSARATNPACATWGTP